MPPPPVAKAYIRCCVYPAEVEIRNTIVVFEKKRFIFMCRQYLEYIVEINIKESIHTLKKVYIHQRKYT